MKINEKQIFKNYETDRYSNTSWEKSIKYFESKELPYELLFAIITFKNKSLKGLPYFLILSGYIKDMDYIYEGVSLSLLFEMFKNQNKLENYFLENNGTFKVISSDVSKETIKRVLTSINDKEVLTPILNENKEILFEKFKGLLSHHNYEEFFSNILHFFYMNRDFDVVNTILFDLNLSNEEIDKLLYSSAFNNDGDTFLLRIMINSDIELLEKIDELYNIDIDKFVSVSSLIENLFSTQNYPEVKKSSLLNHSKITDFFISKGVDAYIAKLRIKEEGKYVFRDPFIDLYENVRRFFNINDFSTRINYYIKNTNTFEENYFFWIMVFPYKKDILNKYYSKLSISEKEDLFQFYSSEQNSECLSFFFNDPDFDLNVKVKEEIAIVRFLCDKRNKDFDNTLKIAYKFLESGSRINDVNQRNMSLKKYLSMHNDDAKKVKVEELISKFENNVQEIISFDMKVLGEIYGNPFKYIDEVNFQLKNILLKKNFFENIDNVIFLKSVDNELYFKVDNDIIVVPKENISGNDFTNKSYRKVV